MSDIVISVVQPGTPEVGICARWRVEAFASVLDTTVEDEKRSLEAFTADQGQQVALIAMRDGIAAGTCLLVPSEIEPQHSVSPWLAGLYVAPEHRRFGVGAALVRAVEDQARSRGQSRLYLYTDDASYPDNAIGFYERLGWTIQDRIGWKGFATAFMVRDL